MAEFLAFLRPDAPHSSLAKLRRDMEYNVLQPIRQHLTNNRNLKSARSHASRACRSIHWTCVHAYALIQRVRELAEIRGCRDVYAQMRLCTYGGYGLMLLILRTQRWTLSRGFDRRSSQDAYFYVFDRVASESTDVTVKTYRRYASA